MLACHLIRLPNAPVKCTLYTFTVMLFFLFWVSFPLFYFLFYFTLFLYLLFFVYFAFSSSFFPHPTFLYGQLLFAAYVLLSLIIWLIPLSFLFIRYLPSAVLAQYSATTCDDFVCFIQTLSGLLQIRTCI